MTRRHRAEKRDVIPDPVYGDVKLSKFINSVMMDGKKSIAESIVYGSLEIIKKKGSFSNPLEAFHDAIEKVRPDVEVRSRRVGGATYQVPMEVRSERAQALAFRWLIANARKRSETTMTERLSQEILDAVNKRGASVKKREDTHKMAEANRAFAHYRW